MLVDSENYDSVVLGSKPRASLLASLFPAEVALASSNHDPEIIVPLILSPSKQQNQESFISKPENYLEEIRTPVLLLPSQTIPSFAEENIVLCKNEGSLSAENPERINPQRGREGSQRAPCLVRNKCHPDTT